MTDFVRDTNTLTQTGHITGGLRFKLHIDDSFEATNVEVLSVKQRSMNVLHQQGINTLGKLMESWADLYKFHSCGATTVKDIKNALMSYYYDGLSTEERKQFWREALGEV